VLFARSGFIRGVDGDVLELDYDGWHQELIAGQLRVADFQWAETLLARIRPTQWRDAFAAGGFDPDAAGTYIRAIEHKRAVARRLASAHLAED